MPVKRPWVLGISSSHNGSACLLHGDEIVAAVQEERLVRFKRAALPGSQTSAAVQYCLQTAGIDSRDLSAVVHSDTLPRELAASTDLLAGQLATFTATAPERVFRLGHHLAHAIGAFATSGFRKSAILVVDGNGTVLEDLSESELAVISATERTTHTSLGRSTPREIISIYKADGVTVSPLHKNISSVSPYKTVGMKPFGSLGDMYGRVGAYLFGSFLDGPGKTMGLAPFGQPIHSPDDFYSINNRSFTFHTKLLELYSQPPHTDLWQQSPGKNLACSVQLALEHALLYLVQLAALLSDETRIAYAGGVALNSVANERIVASNIFQQVSLMAAAEDSGIAIGAAYHGLWQLTNKNSYSRLERDSVGMTYSEVAVESTLLQFPWLKATQLDDVPQQTARLLADGQILGWFDGRSELGPRSLGHRSILCDPRGQDVKERLNSEIKHREAFRPFAPMILREDLGAWFVNVSESDVSPFMLRVLSFNERALEIPAVVHVDNTGRVQTVDTDLEPKLHRLLSAFKQITGIPLLLNTSFNVAGEPIVETPFDALWSLTCTQLDGCLVNQWFVTRKSQTLSLLDLSYRLIASSFIIEQATTPNCSSPMVMRAPFCGMEGANSRYEGARLYPQDRLAITVDSEFGSMLVVTTSNLVLLLHTCQSEQDGYHLHRVMSEQFDWWEKRHSLWSFMTLVRMRVLAPSL